MLEPRDERRSERRAEILRRINQDLPDFDWHDGAVRYLEAFFTKFPKDAVEGYSLTKPLGPITPEDPSGSLSEFSYYLTNFSNSIKLLNLARGASVLDVACGGGWFSHWCRKLGYDAFGLDVSSDFVALAKRRVREDPYLSFSDEQIESMFRAHDVEKSPLPEDLIGKFDAIVLESCLHHFLDPISALENICQGLNERGVVLILEGENRVGSIKQEYMQVMQETQTLERPYTRQDLVEILDFVGLKHFDFLGSTGGFIAQSDPIAQHMTEHLLNITNGSNLCICAQSEEALKRVIPTYTGKAIALNGANEALVPPALSTADRAAAALRDLLPGWSKPVLRRYWQAIRRRLP